MAPHSVVASVLAVGLLTSAAAAQNTYRNTVLVASHVHYNPTVMVDPLLLNGWGISLRPPGAGGHFWVSNFASGTTTTYVGDAHGVALHQDDVKVINIGKGKGKRYDGRLTAEVPQPTGQVYNYSTTDFVVSGEGITGASKFIFVTAEGTISGWVEATDPTDPKRKVRQTESVVVLDRSHEFDDDRLIYTGCAVTDYPRDNLLFITDLTAQQVEVYDKNFKRVALPAGRFRYPDQLADYVAWNIQYFRTGPNGEGRLWAAFCQTEEPWEQMPDTGEVAEFDLEGNFIRMLHQCKHDDPWANGELRAPWGFAVAPADFGPLSNAMLVANFGDGTIAGYSLGSGRFIDFLRDDDGLPIMIDGLWGIAFGNGVSLGDSNALYYAAGPNSEQDGTFGSVRFRGAACNADVQTDGVVNSRDFFDFLTMFLAAQPGADFNRDGVVDTRDFFDFVSCSLGGC